MEDAYVGKEDADGGVGGCIMEDGGWRMQGGCSRRMHHGGWKMEDARSRRMHVGYEEDACRIEGGWRMEDARRLQVGE